MSPDQLNLQPFDFLPLWAVYIVTVILFLLAVEAGFRLSKIIQRRGPDKAESNVGALSAATLALLAFLIAFVTSTAVNVFSARRQAVVAEANAIGTAYLRAGYLPDPYGPESRQLLAEYVDQRLAALDETRLAQAIARSEEIHIAFILTLAVAFYLIADLNRGDEGLLRVSQQAMFDLQRQLSAN